MSDSIGPKDFIEIGVGLALGAISAVGLLARRYSFKPKTWSFAGVEYDIARFEDLTQVAFFAHVTKLALPASAHPLNVADATDPVALIYAGWSLVCDSFVREFHVYPTDPLNEPTVLSNATAWSATTGGALLNTEWGATTDAVAITRLANEMDAALMPWIF